MCFEKTIDFLIALVARCGVENALGSIQKALMSFASMWMQCSDHFNCQRSIARHSRNTCHHTRKEILQPANSYSEVESQSCYNATYWTSALISQLSQLSLSQLALTSRHLSHLSHLVDIKFRPVRFGETLLVGLRLNHHPAILYLKQVWASSAR